MSGGLFSGGIPAAGWSIVTFTEAETSIPEVRSEYYQYDSGVKFHFFRESDTFPEGFGDCILSALSAFPSERVIVEYVPEVDSWYAQVKDIHTLTPALIEGLLRKVSAAVEKHGKE